MKCVHISAKVQSRIESLKKSGKAGLALAQKATRIIKYLTSETGRYPIDSKSSFTKYGEKRIQNCRKYDLGCGFRLITLQRGMKLFIQFLGTHDECQRWLGKNSRLKKVVTGKGALFRISRQDRLPKRPKNDDSADIRHDEEDKVPAELNDRDLRSIFCGLVKSSGKPWP
jgi:hypothetical protein